MSFRKETDLSPGHTLNAAYFPQCIKLPAPRKSPKIAALPMVVCPMYLIFISPGTCE